MGIRRNTAGRVAPFLFAAMLAAIQWSAPAEAFHVKGITVTPTSVDSATRTVNVDVVESTVGTGSAHTQANVQWGDGMTSFHAWTGNTTTVGGGKNFRVTGVAHVYPDLTDRTIKVFSDCCNASFLTATDTAVIQLGCSDAPKGGCRQAGNSLVAFKNNLTDDNKDSFQFKWLKGDATTFGALGDPTSSTQYFVCVYAPGLVFQSIVPAGATNWSVNGGSTQYKYKDNTGANGGITNIKLKSGIATKAQVLVKGKGLNLDDPLPLTQPVTVQVQNSDEECWEHAFTSPETKNDNKQFKDKEP